MHVDILQRKSEVTFPVVFFIFYCFVTAAGSWICNPENRSAGVSFTVITDKRFHIEGTEDGWYSPSPYVRLLVLADSLPVRY